MPNNNGNQNALVQKVWNDAHVLRDQGVSCGDYIEQITYLLLLPVRLQGIDVGVDMQGARSTWDAVPSSAIAESVIWSSSRRLSAARRG